MANPGQLFRVVVSKSFDGTCLADVMLPYSADCTIQDVLINVDFARSRAGQGPANWRDTFWNCGHDLTRWHSNHHSWRFTLSEDSEMIAQNALLDDYLVNSDGSIELHLQATRVRSTMDTP